MEPPAVPNTVKLEKCAGVVAPSDDPAPYAHTKALLVTFFTNKDDPAMTCTRPAALCVGDDDTLLPRSTVQRSSPLAASNAYMRVSLPALTGEVTMMEPSLATSGLLVEGASSVAFHLTTPDCPATAYSASLTKYTVLSLPSAGELSGALDSCEDHASAPLLKANAPPLGLPTYAVAGAPGPSTGELVTAPAPVLAKDICMPLEAEKFAMPPFTPATNHAPLPPIAGVDSVAPAGPE